MFKIASSDQSHSRPANSSRGSSNWILLSIVAVIAVGAGFFISLNSSAKAPLSPSVAVAEVVEVVKSESKCPITGAIRSLIGSKPHHHPVTKVSTDDIAETVSDEASPVRIATLLPFAADQLIAMGVTPVCVPGLRGQTPEVWNGIPSVQLDHSAGPNLEQLIAVEPDYIVTGSTYSQFMPHIESVTEAEIVVMDVESIDSVFDHINTLGEISSRPQESQKIILDIKSRLMPPVEAGRDPLKVLAIFGTPHSFFAFMPDTYLGDLVSHSGARIGPEGLVSHKVYKGLAPLSMETVVEFNPDLLLVLFHGPEDTSRAMFESDPLWSSLTAVDENRMFFLADDIYAMRPGSQLDLAMSQVNDYIKDVEQRLQ